MKNVLGLSEDSFCESRIFFRRINHPGANNCACPKCGNSCVPPSMVDAWYAYIGFVPAPKHKSRK